MPLKNSDDKYKQYGTADVHRSLNRSSDKSLNWRTGIKIRRRKIQSSNLLLTLASIVIIGFGPR
jgi:hypothetical protein